MNKHYIFKLYRLAQWYIQISANRLIMRLNRNHLVILTAPFFSLLFTSPRDFLITEQQNNLFLEVVLINMGASLGIFLINTYAFKSDYLKLFPVIDILLILLELLQFGAFSDNLQLRYGLYAIKKIGSGAVGGVNYYLGVMMIKKKLTSFREFMKTILVLYIWFDFGIVVGVLLKNLPQSIPYLPITTLCSIARLLYVKFHPKWESVQPDKHDLQVMNIRKQTLNNAYQKLSLSFFETQGNANEVVERIFNSGHIKFFFCFFLITVATEITPTMMFQIEAVAHSPRYFECMYAVFQLFGTVAVYIFADLIGNKLKYYITMGILVSICCFLIFVCEKFFDGAVAMLMPLLLIYMALHGASLGPFFYVFVGFRYNRVGFSICYITKWLIYALQSVLSLYSHENQQTDRYDQIIVESVMLILIMFIIYMIMKENEIIEMEIQDKTIRREEVQRTETVVDLRDSSVVELPE